MADQASSVTRRSLSPGQQALLALLQRIRFGRILRLRVRGGEPDLRGVQFCRTVKVLGENRPHPAAEADDFRLRQEVAEFFRLLHDLGDAEVTDVEVRNGLPFTFEVAGATAE